MQTQGSASTFDLEETEYYHSLDQGLSVSGEGRVFFARGRVAFLETCLAGCGVRPRTILDFGCGSGGTSALLRDVLGAHEVVGIDVSQRLLESARRSYSAAGVRFATRQETVPNGTFDLAFCNGVLHHIPVSQRAETIGYVRDSLRPGGLFALWDNNPWNPGARYVMHRIPFDRDAVMISAYQARHLLRAQGFDILRVDYLFVFPRFLKGLRFLEAPLSRFPLGAQFQVLARRPLSAVS